MSTRSIGKNFIYNAVLVASNVLLPLITFPYVTRVLQPEAIGQVEFANSVANYFVMFAALGIPTYGIRACARVRDDRAALSQTVRELLVINTGTMLLALAAMLASTALVPRLRVDAALLLVNAFLVLLNPIGLNWLYSALEEYRYITLRSILFKLVSLVCIFLLVRRPQDVILYTGINVFATVGSNLCNLLYSRRYISYRRLAHYELKKHLRPIFVFFATSVAVSIYTNLDTVMLGFLSGNAQVGYYGTALKVRSVLAAVISALSTVTLPRLSYYAVQQQDDAFRALLRKAANFTYVVALPVTLFFCLCARSTVRLLSGESFLPAVPALRFLTVAVLFAGFSGITGTQLLVPRGQEKRLLQSILCGAALDFVLNLFLIPRYGAAGAAFATMLAEAAVLAAQVTFSWSFLRQELPRLGWCKPTLAALGAAAALTPVLAALQNAGPFLLLAAAACVFFGVYAAALLLLKDETAWQALGQLKQNLPRHRK